MFLGLNLIKYPMMCPYCNHCITYDLKTEQKKCAKCKKKFSPKLIKRNIDIINSFCQNKSASQTANQYELSYTTVKKRYDLFRKHIANYLEEVYKEHQTQEYDEYIYLAKSKKKIKENIFDAQNFLTFSYGDNKVYNLLMPNLHRYKQQFLNDGADEVYFREFSRFMMFNKIAKTKQRENIISSFWNYFEESILKYKGVDNESFIYYLKEIEFKFNYKLQEQIEILNKIITK